MSEKIIKKGKRFINMDSRLQICGNRKIYVDGCKKIIEYNDVMIKVKTWDMTVTVWGNGLQADDFGSGSVIVFGRIQSVELEENT